MNERELREKVKEDRESPPEIPRLPNAREELLKLKEKPFEILIQGPPDPTFESEGINEIWRVLRCNFCGMVFFQIVHIGHFFTIKEPSMCPNCDFPQNVEKKLSQL